MKIAIAFLLGTTTLLVNTVTTFGASTHRPSPTNSHGPNYAHSIIRSSRSQTLYDQNSNDNGYAIVSQNFESSFDAYDAQAADDFVVPIGGNWRVTEIDVTGQYFNGPGPAVSESVFFYKTQKGLPGKLIHEFASITGADNGTGSFAIVLPGEGQKLKPGHFWVSVQVNMDFSIGGEWGWENSSVVQNLPAAWQNPGGGFGVGCTKWAYAYTCVPETPISDGSYDQMFALKGKTKGG